MITVQNLKKRFQTDTVLDGISMTVPSGSIYGLVGTNGAGKTTLIRHLTGILKPDEGEILFDGKPVYENPEVKEKIGLVSDDLEYLSSYTLKEIARYYRSVYSKWDEDGFQEMREAMKLPHTKKMSGFSKGMKKQAALIMALSFQPEYLLLDEPIDGLDPIVRKIIWRYVIDRVAQGMTVLISSHNLREIEGICDCIAILDQGKIRIESNLDELKSETRKVQVALQKDSAAEWELALASREVDLTILHREKHGNIEFLIVQNEEEHIHRVMKPFKPVLLDVLPLSLEEIFIYELGGDRYDISSILL